MALSPEERARINRENAKKSTGPKTAEGKARSCMNARRNWLNGQFFIFTEEERLAYLSYAQQQRIAYAPVGPLEDDLVQHIIDNSWLIRRYQSAEFNVRSFEGLPALNAGHDGEVPAAASEHQFLFKSENGLYSVELLGRHYARVERTLLKYRAELWKAQKERRDAVYWDTTTGKYEGEPTCCAQVYVFCHYPERDKSKASVLDPPAWDFYVVSAETLNREFPTAKLASVRRVSQQCKFEQLRSTVDGSLGVDSVREHSQA
jgi:hypothetical protein